MAARKTKAKPNISAQELTQYYEDMLLIRRFEEKAGQLYGMGLIGGFCHLYIGQEAVVVGLEAAAEEGDKRLTSYRDHGHMLAAGMDPNGVMAELTGRIDGYSKGKGGSMHMFSKEKHFYGGHGIVGAQVPIGAGLAFADKYLENNRPKGARLTDYPIFGRFLNPQSLKAVAEFKHLAEKNGLSVSELSLAFVMSRPFVSTTIIGATKINQLNSAKSIPDKMIKNLKALLKMKRKN